MRWLTILAMAGIVLNAIAAFADEGLPELTPEQLEKYQFENSDTSPPAKVSDLSSGQQFILESKRKEIKELIALKLGVLSFNNTKADLKTIQQIYDRKILRDDQLQEWQAVGVLFGDILAREFGLHWVSYEDELGESKALAWRDTRNFVFPITVFSKRLQFNEVINAESIYASIKADVDAFKARESRLGARN